MEGKHSQDSILPYVTAKRKQIKVLTKFLGKRILFGKQLGEYSEEVRGLKNMGHVEVMAKNANKKLIEHQGKAMKLQAFLDRILEVARNNESEAIELYHAGKMLMTGNIAPSMMGWAETRVEIEEKGLGGTKPQSGIPFARMGEYVKNVMMRAHNPPNKLL